MRISDWSSDVCSSDLDDLRELHGFGGAIAQVVGRHHLRGVLDHVQHVVEARDQPMDFIAVQGVMKVECSSATVWCVILSARSSMTSISSAYRSEEHTSELQSLMRISYAVFCLKKKNHNKKLTTASI